MNNYNEFLNFYTPCTPHTPSTPSTPSTPCTPHTPRISDQKTEFCNVHIPDNLLNKVIENKTEEHQTNLPEIYDYFTQECLQSSYVPNLMKGYSTNSSPVKGYSIDSAPVNPPNIDLNKNNAENFILNTSSFVPGTNVYRDISDVLNFPQSQAAKLLKIHPSTLSKRWKEATLNRKWPWRNVNKIDKQVESILNNIDKNYPIPQEIENYLAALLAKRQEQLVPVVIRIS